MSYFKKARISMDSFLKVFSTIVAGCIGSHSRVELLDEGMDVTVFDNFYNSHHAPLARVAQITGKKPTLMQGNIRDCGTLGAALRASGESTVIHFTGHKSVGELMQKMQADYHNNVVGCMSLLQVL